jgi:hypothetical protein
MEVNMAERDGVGMETEQAENCSLAGSRTCGGESWRRVWMNIWTESASSSEISWRWETSEESCMTGEGASQ